MAELGPLTQALVDIAHHGDDQLLAGEICQACVARLRVDGAAISLMTATDARETLSASDATARVIEDLQFTLGEGVCVEAAASGCPVLVPDLHDRELTTRWPVFATAVAEQTDVRALFALPLQLGTINLGVLDLYRTTPGPLRGDELRDVLSAAETATVILLDVPVRTRDGHPGGQAHGSDDVWWDGTYSDRAEVHQATGMVLAQLGIPAHDAFVRLRAYAFAHCRPLAEIAREVVARRLVFTEDMS